MPTLETLQLPHIDTAAYGGREAKKIAGHLYQVEEQLRYVLGHLDEDNLSEGLKAKIESGGMGSEVLQTLDAITLRVAGQDDAMAELRIGLTGISATVQEQGGAISTLEQTAQGILSTVEQNKNDAASALQQTAERITATVAEVYSTKAELTSTVEQTAGSILSTVADGYTSKTELRQTLGSLTLAVENGETASTLRLLAGETELSSGEITLAGVVTFRDLAEENGRTIINGSNITTGELDASLIKTGVIQNRAGTTTYDLDNGTIQMGATSGPHVTMDNQSVRWWLNANDRTGLFYSVYGVSYIGANSKRVYMGWVPGQPNTGVQTSPADTWQYYGVRIEEGGFAHWNVEQVECNGQRDDGTGSFQASVITASHTLNAPAGGKSAVIPTKDYGIVRMVCAESPIPQFFDNGSGVIDETGKCWLFLRDEFLCCVSGHAAPQWHVTGTGPLTLQKEGLAAVVAGAPGTTFDWICFMPQRGCEAMYCEPSDYDWGKSMDRKDYIAGYELESIEGFAQALDDEVLTVSRENGFIEETWPEQLERSF